MEINVGPQKDRSSGIRLDKLILILFLAEETLLDDSVNSCMAQWTCDGRCFFFKLSKCYGRLGIDQRNCGHLGVL